MKIGIIGAMDVEVRHLRDAVQDGTTTTVAGMVFDDGTIGGTPVTVVRCGVGKVDAAMCAQVLIDRFGVDRIINTGVAGSLDARLNIGDVLVSTDAVHHDVDATNFGYALGEVPSLGIRFFPADAGLRAAAVEAVRAAAPDVACVEGRVASGDQFVRTQDQKDRIKREFDASCVEMEGASIAQTAWLNGVPFVIVRAISDKADGSAEVEYPVFEAKAAEHCARIVRHMVAHLS
ncbi:MAG: 5'-methylthioadenosine/adenosylhomocysteine nucleosidase [Parafannyhessea sp.]|uniref:5'-methylthioadenosine/adenosylhomocysteine nucleosidase n=1 Tax=Parafannyhessea sp. TaxID=2847324 RepID=UPI003EFC106F